VNENVALIETCTFVCVFPFSFISHVMDRTTNEDQHIRKEAHLKWHCQCRMSSSHIEGGSQVEGVQE